MEVRRVVEDLGDYAAAGVAVLFGFDLDDDWLAAGFDCDEVGVARSEWYFSAEHDELCGAGEGEHLGCLFDEGVEGIFVWEPFRLVGCLYVGIDGLNQPLEPGSHRLDIPTRVCQMRQR